MSKLTVDEVLAEMTASHKEDGAFNYNRFNKKNFEKLMTAMLNDPKFTTKVAKAKQGELETVEEIEVSKKMRKYFRKIIEKAGIDKAESERIMGDDFKFDNVDGWYEFIATAIYLYMQAGNRFDLLPKEDFKGSICMKRVKKSSKTSASHHPQTREYLGDFETTKEEHSELTCKSSCPKWLTTRKKVK
jgi:hypothetical protein